MATEHEGKGKKNAEASLTTKDVQRNFIFGRYSEAEMIAQLKGIALDPCSPQFALDKIRPLFNQILRLRKIVVLNDSEIPWRKRKIEQFIKDKLTPPSFTVADQQNTSKLRRRNLSHASSVSCLVNSAECTEVHADKTVLGSHSPSSLLTCCDTIPENSTKHSFMEERSFRDNNISPILDSGESAIGSNPPTPMNMTLKPAAETRLANHHLNSPNRKHLQPPRKSKRLLNFIGDSLQRSVIPVGPRFQADTPEWSGLLDRRVLINQYKTANWKWLGTKVWPTEARTVKNTGKTIGKGRPDSCRCVVPGSVDCVKHHCLEARLLLQSDIGPAFFSWKFDEMGIQVSKSWMLKDEQTFESVMKMKPSSGKDFLKHALKSIAQKSRNDILSYYFNVYLPRRFSLQTRTLSIGVVDTDDESEEIIRAGVPKKSEERAVIASKSSQVKAQYLRAF